MVLRPLCAVLLLLVDHVHSDAVPSAPRVILTTRGIDTDQLRDSFLQMVAAARTSEDTLKVSVIVTAMLSQQLPVESKADAVAQSTAGNAPSADARREAAAASSRALVEKSGLKDSQLHLIDAARDPPEQMQAALASSAAIFVLGGNSAPTT